VGLWTDILNNANWTNSHRLHQQSHPLQYRHHFTSCLDAPTCETLSEVCVQFLTPPHMDYSNNENRGALAVFISCKIKF